VLDYRGRRWDGYRGGYRGLRGLGITLLGGGGGRGRHLITSARGRRRHT